MRIFLLLDRTGSMAPIWAETVQSINSYVADLQQDHADDRLTLAVFDLHEGFQFTVVRDGLRLGDWKPFSETAVTPRGMTPLFDALARIVAMAEAANEEKTVLVVMTDGHENASREVTRQGAKAALERIRARNWQVVFLGADFDAFDQAAQVGVGAAMTLSSAPGHMAYAMRATARETRSYKTSGAPMTYREEDRKQSGEAQVTNRKMKRS
ncbi:MAG TPA: vWA domain-containing protein [bacterium]|jgi:uncharacterized protein YegL